MNRNNSLGILLAIALAATTTSALAAADDQHDSHPGPKASAASLNKPGNATSRAGDGGMPSGAGMSGMQAGTGMAGMGAQMQAMHDMHDKMMAAKTPEERNALMAEHMKVVQEGMSTMNRMGPGATQGGPAGKPTDMATRQRSAWT